MDRGPVKIHRYDPGWAMAYEAIRDELSQTIGDKTNLIEHVGSTSIEGLGAKPIIDILITVERIEQADELIEPIETLGYTYVDKYEKDLPFRRYFVLYDGTIHKVHIHVVPHGHEFHLSHIAFRDYLRSHSDVRDEYHLLKTRLANKHGNDREGYQKGKEDFISRVTNIALQSLDDDYVK